MIKLFNPDKFDVCSISIGILVALILICIFVSRPYFAAFLLIVLIIDLTLQSKLNVMLKKPIE